MDGIRDGIEDDRVAYGLLARHTDQLLCSHCLAEGRRTPVPQVISARHRPRSLCAACRNDKAGQVESRLAGLVSLLGWRRADRQ